MPRAEEENYKWQIPIEWLKNFYQQNIVPVLRNRSHRNNFIRLNRSLFFDKYTLRPFDKVNNITFTNDDGKIIPITSKNLSVILNLRCPISKQDYIFLKNRRKSAVDAISFKLRTKTRLIVNHGGESVLESNIALHPLYGFPIIYGSAIKGVTRHYCKEYKNNIDRNTIREIFGSESEGEEEQAGFVVFADAWPENYDDLNALEIDILTPHYKDYYEDKKFPRDNIQPQPHQFLAVKKGVIFEFIIYPSSKPKFEQTEKTKLLNLAKDYIIEALCTIGIGAKTTSSYGYFEKV
ncbi:MAG: type III-B CRISPR module RAMP protein Cmr6 [candidate division WOR-3 bacterium]|nr:type III-B CRISPR module RAMP protein Cmr6 [candidate division WOR-3 bacterium]